MKSTKQVFYTNGEWGCSTKETDITGYGATPSEASKDYDSKLFMTQFRADTIDPALLDSLITDSAA